MVPAEILDSLGPHCKAGPAACGARPQDGDWAGSGTGRAVVGSVEGGVARFLTARARARARARTGQNEGVQFWLSAFQPGVANFFGEEALVLAEWPGRFESGRGSS